MQEQVNDLSHENTSGAAAQDLTAMNGRPKKVRVAGNTATNTLKLIALLFMVIDHVGAVFFTLKTGHYIPEMRMFGRIAFPLYAWCITVGAEYTRDIGKYLLRILIIGAIAQPVYAWAMHHEWYQFNIYATLFLGLIGIAGIKLNRFGSRYWMPLLAVMISLVVKVDYGFQGVLFIMFLYMCRERRSAIVAVIAAYCLFWGYTSGSQLTEVFGITLPKKLDWLPYGQYLLNSIFRMQACAAFAIPFMVLRMKNIRYPKRSVQITLMGHTFSVPVDVGKIIGYAAYPGHLLIIGIIRARMGI